LSHNTVVLFACFNFCRFSLLFVEDLSRRSFSLFLDHGQPPLTQPHGPLLYRLVDRTARFNYLDRASSFFSLRFVVKNVEMAGWTAEDLAGRGCCGSVVAVAFFAWSFLFVRPVVAVCGSRRGR
jgi:hypothetical protein